MAIQILRQPTSLVVREGSTAAFRVYISDTTVYGDDEPIPEISYTWEYSMDGGAIFNSPTSGDSDYSSRMKVSPLTSGYPGSMLTIKNVPPGMNNATIRCVITQGDEIVETMGVLLVVMSNEEITSNFKMEYTSLYTGEEIDEAIRRVLGYKYDTDIIPGTRLIGRYYDEPADLNELDIPGVYTAHFYINGPIELEVTNGNTPIQISVFTCDDYTYSGTTSLFQIIIAMTYAVEDMNEVGIAEGSSLLYLFYRDLYDPNTDIASETHGWQKLLLSNGNMKIINNLDSYAADAVLSANMGRYLYELMKQNSVGGANVIQASGSRATMHNPNTRFNTVWKQVTKESADSDTVDSEVKGYRLFEMIGKFHSGKVGNYTSSNPFNSANFFKDFIDNDSITINTSNTNRIEMDSLHTDSEGTIIPFSENGTYAYMVRDSHDALTKYNDEAYTASVSVQINGEYNENASIFVQLYLCEDNTENGTHSHIPVDLIYLNEQDAQTDENGEAYPGKVLKTIVSQELAVTSHNFPGIQDEGNSVKDSKWVRMSATIEGVRQIIQKGHEGAPIYTLDGTDTGAEAHYDAKYVKMVFGIKGLATARFKDIKLERGKTATDGSMTIAEMWNEFDNANFIRAVPVDTEVDISSLTEKDGLVFKLNDASIVNTQGKGRWIRRHLATGGGGGFVIQATPPTETEVLWYVHATPEERASSDTTVQRYVAQYDSNDYVTTVSTSGNTLTHYGEAFYYYDPQGAAGPGWYPAENNYHVGITAPANINMLWLDTNNGKYNASESPDLKYYDRTYNKWRIVGAEARPAWVIQDTPPTAPDDDLMWITTSGIASVPYNRPNSDGTTTRIWLPIQAIWGHND